MPGYSMKVLYLSGPGGLIALVGAACLILIVDKDRR